MDGAFIAVLVKSIFRPTNGAVEAEKSSDSKKDYDDGPEGMAPEGVIEVKQFESLFSFLIQSYLRHGFCSVDVGRSCGQLR